MKATGIVRRIDDLGRVVIPKEIRRTLRIREGDPLEIFTDRNGEVIFKKYSPMGELNQFITQLCDSVSKTTGTGCVICDRDSVIAVSGTSKKDIYERSISAELEKAMENRQIVHPQADMPLRLINDDRYQVSLAAPVISSGDVSGCVALLSDAQHPTAGEVEVKLLQTAANFLGQQMTM